MRSSNHPIRYDTVALLEIIRQLRDPQTGCSWELQQEFSTIAKFTLEEAYELVDAIEIGEVSQVVEELGDLFFQIVFYSQLGAERNLFTFESVVDAIAKKLIRRHPRLLEDTRDEETKVDSELPSDLIGAWEKIKKRERTARSMHSLMDNVPLVLPALSRAQKLQKRASTVGLDWVQIDDFLKKIVEETQELKLALDDGIFEDIENELGDVLFSVVNLARRLGVDAETSLRRSNSKFEARVRAMEADALREGSDLAKESIEQLDRRWALVKSSL